MAPPHPYRHRHKEGDGTEWNEGVGKSAENVTSSVVGDRTLLDL